MEKDALIQAAPLLQGSVIDQRRDIKYDIVGLILSSSRFPREFDVGKVISVCKESLGISLDRSTVVGILDEFEADEQVEYVQGTDYRILEKPETQSLDSIIEPIWQEFSSVLQDHDEEIDIHYINENMKRAFRNFLLEFFFSISETSQILMETQTERFNDSVTRDVVETVIDNTNMRDPDTFEDALFDYIENPRTRFLDFTNNVYTGIVNREILTREEEIDIPLIDAAGKTLILDTNVLVHLLCQTERGHLISRTICERSSELDFRLRYTSETADELDRFIRGSKKEMSGLYTGNNSQETIRSQFVKDFQRCDVASWDEYISDIQNWREHISSEYDITQVREAVEDDVDIREEVKSILVKSRRGQGLSEQAISRLNHDSSLFGYVANLRKDIDQEPRFGPFVISFHNDLTAASSTLSEQHPEDDIVGSQEIALQPRTWLNYLIAFASARIDQEDDSNRISLALLRLASDTQESLDLEEYAKILAPKVGLEGEDKDYLAEFLLNHPLSNELKSALYDNRGAEAENISRQILTDDEYINTIQEERDFENRVRNASSRIQEMEERIDSLESELETYRSDEADGSERIIVNVNAESEAVASSSTEVTISEEQFRTEYVDFINMLDTRLENGIESTEGVDPPPDDDSEISDIHTWLQSTAALISSVSNGPKTLSTLQPIAEELLSKADVFL